MTRAGSPNALQSVRHVADFGARGESGADDSRAFQAAFDALPTVDGVKVGTLRCDDRRYWLGDGPSGFDIHGKVAIEGVPGGATRLAYTGPGYLLGLNAVTGRGKASHDWKIRNLILDGAGKGATGIRAGQTGAGDKSAGGLFDHVQITGFTDAGLHAVGLQLWRAFHLRCENNPGAGVRFDAGADNTTGTLTSCHFSYNGVGMHVRSLVGTTFQGCAFEANAEQAIHVQRSTANGWPGARELHFTSPWIEGNCVVGGSARAAVEFDSLDGQDQRNGTPGAHMFMAPHLASTRNGKKHLYLLDGDFVFWFPSLSSPANTTGLQAPDCAVLTPTGGNATVDQRAQTRIWWSDWRATERTWANVGANVELYAMVADAAGTGRTKTFTGT